jgi:hypothetical protein
MERLKRYFTDQGLGAADIPAAIVVHEVISIGMAAGFWAGCYALQPSRTFMRPIFSQAAKNKALEQGYATALARAQVTACFMFLFCLGKWLYAQQAMQRPTLMQIAF